MGLQELVLVALVVIALVRSLGRCEEPPGPDDLALDLSQAAHERTVESGTVAARPFQPPKPGRSEAFRPAGKPIVLVLDDPGRDRGGRVDHHSRHDSQRCEQWTHSLKGVRRRSPWPQSIVSSDSCEVTLIQRNLTMMPFAFLPNLGHAELMIVAFVSLLIFGNRLPSVMRSLGKSVTEFKKGISGIRGRHRSGGHGRQEAEARPSA